MTCNAQRDNSASASLTGERVGRTRTHATRNLAAGDAAVVERGYSYTNLEIRTVDRVTATQVLIGNMRFCRKRGYLKGQTTRCTPICLSEPTPSNLDRAFRQKAAASPRYQVAPPAAKRSRIGSMVAALVRPVRTANGVGSPPRKSG